MLAQATGFALLAAISPTSLLVMAVFLGSDNPRRTALTYVAGATLMTAAMAVTVLFAIRAAGLDQPREQDARYGLRLGLGVLALAAAVIVSWRKRPAPEAGKTGPGMLSRLTAQPRPATAFIAGLILFAPSATFVAAVQAIATANTHPPITALGLAIVVAVTLMVVWLPLVAYLAAPDATTRRLKAVNSWLRDRGKLLVIGALAICGIVLIINGALGLAGVI